MKRKYKNGKQKEAAKETTSQGTSSPSQSPPQSSEAHNKISPAALVASAPLRESPVKVKGLGGKSVVHPAPDKGGDCCPSIASESSTGDWTIDYLGSVQEGQQFISMSQEERERIEQPVEVLRDIEVWGFGG
jgi:hypothetical protein